MAESARQPHGQREWLRAYKVLIGFGFHAAPREATLFLLCGVIMALYPPITAYGAKLLVDAALEHDPSRAVIAVGFLAATVGVSLLNSFYYLDFLFTVAEKASSAVNHRLIGLIVDIPGLAHHERPEYLKELDLLREQQGALAWMTNATAGMIRVVVGLLASLALLAHLDPVLLLLPLLSFGSIWAGRRARDLQHRAAEATAESERLRRHLFGLATSAAPGQELRIFDLADHLVHRHHQAADAVILARNQADWRSAIWEALGAALFGLGYVAAIGLVVLRAMNGLSTPGDVVLTIGLAAGLNGVVQVAVGYGTHFLHVLRVAQRYLWLEDYASNVRPTVTSNRPVPVGLKDGIEIRNLSFQYPGSSSPILTDVSLRLPAGKIIALVGENGAGKTTLVKLLCRFYEPDRGQILVDGSDLRSFSIDDWWTRLRDTFQDFCRFEFRLRETVGVGRVDRIEDASEVEAALDRAGASDIPRSLPLGLETQLGRAWEGGIEISGGQWQKLALARSLMRPEPLLEIFDEPTAALDASTEHALFERMTAAAHRGDHAGTVTILVTHRFSTVRMADLIVVLEGGRNRRDR